MQLIRSVSTTSFLVLVALGTGACKTSASSADAVDPGRVAEKPPAIRPVNRTRVRLPASVPHAERDSAELLIRAMQRRVAEADRARARRDTAQELDRLELALSMGDPSANPAWVGQAMSMNGLRYDELRRRVGQLQRVRPIQAK